MFSVIIPLYNKASYVEKAVNSVLSQTFRDFELIIVDDGSTDGGIENVLKTNIQSVKHQIIKQTNAGVSAARNTGYQAATYPYIAFLDADDWWDENFLKEMSKLITDFPDAGIYGSKYFIVKHGNGSEVRLMLPQTFTSGIISYFELYAATLQMPLWTGAVVVRKTTMYDLHGFNTQLKLGEDFDLWVRIAILYPVAYLNKPLAYYNQDVEVKHRGVVRDRIYEPSTHFIFNLDYLIIEEKKNPELKKLLDLLRVYTLLRYRLSRKYPLEYQKEISKVDFKSLPVSIKINYMLPVLIIKSWLSFRIAVIEFKKLFKK